MEPCGLNWTATFPRVDRCQCALKVQTRPLYTTVRRLGNDFHVEGHDVGSSYRAREELPDISCANATAPQACDRWRWRCGCAISEKLATHERSLVGRRGDGKNGAAGDMVGAAVFYARTFRHLGRRRNACDSRHDQTDAPLAADQPASGPPTPSASASRDSQKVRT